MLATIIITFGCTNDNQTENFTYLSDTLDLLNDEETKDIIKISRKIREEIGSEIIVLIISTTGDKTIEEYSIEKAEELNIGREHIYDGIIIILAVNDRATRIEVGYGLEKVITDDIAGKIIREFMLPQFMNENYAKGLINGISEISSNIYLKKELIGNVEGIKMNIEKSM